MDELRLCAACSAWNCRTDDAWCGNCGAPCALLTLDVQPSIVQVRNLAPPMTFRIENRSCAEAEVEHIVLPPWVVLQDAPAKLPAYGSVRFSGRARTIALETPEAVQVEVRTRMGKAAALLMAIEERPTVLCKPAEIEVWGTDRMCEAVLTLAPQAGSLRLRGVRPGPSAGLQVTQGIQPELVISPSAPATVEVRGEVDRLRSRPVVSLLLDFDGPHGPGELEVPIRVAARNPPEIRWEGEHRRPVERYKSPTQELEFVLCNQAADGRDGGARNGRLTILSASLEAPTGAHAPIRLLSPLPVTLYGGQSTALRFDANFSAAPSHADVPLSFTLRVGTDGPSLQKQAAIFVRQLPEFDGVMAIDFGSSNTCCALAETGREYERQRLDAGNVSSPTIIRYLDLAGEEPEVEIGLRVQELAGKEEQVAASAVSRLKQRLGDERQSFPVRPSRAAEWTSRTASEAASDYLHEIRRIVESHKHAIFNDFILTHPAVCSLRQYRNLHRALMHAFGEKARQVRFIQEPIAALVPFMAEQGRDRTLGSYTVASFDLGGGTTDIAAVRVAHADLAAGRREIRPQILYSRGVRFGGEDLTDFLVVELETRLDHLIARAEPAAMLVRMNLPGASMEDILLNSYTLREAAEQFKAGLSDEKRTASQDQVIARILQPGSGTRNFACSFDDIRRAGDRELESLFLDEVKRRVRETADLLRSAMDRTGPLDIVHISGKTTFLPIVSETLKELFPNCRVVRARDPKECVVTGACLARAMSRGASLRLLLPSTASRTTSSIGLYDALSAAFTVLLPVDTEIPAEGLAGELPNAWFGSERVAVWENLGITEGELLTGGGSQLLSKLGTWEPLQRAVAAEENGWTLRLLLKDFELSVHAAGPLGEIVAFARMGEAGEM